MDKEQSIWFEDITLESEQVLLRPLLRSDKDALIAAASDGELWKLWYTSVPSAETIDAYIDRAIRQRKEHSGHPFVVIDKKTGSIIGSTRYCNAKPKHRRLEIGYTWYAKSYQRSYVNKVCKRLLLEYAFETLNCIVVQFQTNVVNKQSRLALARLGAQQDGIIRNHRILKDGTIRDTALYSITAKEWPGIKLQIEAWLRSKQR